MLTWIAEYKNKEIIQQYDKANGNKKERPFSKVEQEKLKSFTLLDNITRIKYTVDLSGDKKLIYRKRNYLNTKGEKWTNYILGWEDESGKHLNFITSARNVILTDNFELM